MLSVKKEKTLKAVKKQIVEHLFLGRKKSIFKLSTKQLHVNMRRDIHVPSHIVVFRKLSDEGILQDRLGRALAEEPARINNRIH